MGSNGATSSDVTNYISRQCTNPRTYAYDVSATCELNLLLEGNMTEVEDGISSLRQEQQLPYLLNYMSNYMCSDVYYVDLRRSGP